jgi:hypothetical protein
MLKLPWFVTSRALRRKAKFARMAQNGLCVTSATEEAHYEDAFRLVHLGYVYEGIEPLQPLGLRMTEQHVLSEATVLVAYDQSVLLGTMTVTFDSPAGLPLENDYPQEVGRLRERFTLAEFGSFALVRRAWGSGVAQHLSLGAFRWALQMGRASHVVIGIHPRAIPFYKAVWGFELIGDPRTHSTLRAPVAPMAVSGDRLVSHLARHFPRECAPGLRPVDYVTRSSDVPGIDLPDPSSLQDPTRWKMSRRVFRRLFLEESNHLRTLDHRTIRHLKSQRTDLTLGRLEEASEAVA